MKINAYKIVKDPIQVFTIAKTKKYKELIEKYIAIETKEVVLFLGRKEALLNFENIGIMQYEDLYKSQKILLIKKAFEHYCKSLNYKRVKSGLFVVLDSDPELVNGVYISQGFDYRVEELNNYYYIVISPRNIITVDGTNYDPEIAWKMSSALIDHLAIKYRDFCIRFKSIIQKIGEVVELPLNDCGSINIKISDSINSKNIKLIGEPLIAFGGGREHTFPAAGLKKYSPLDYNESSSERPDIIESAYIGTTYCRGLLEVLQTGDRKIPPFSYIYKSRLTFPRECCFILTQDEIDSCTSIDDIIGILKNKAVKINSSGKKIKLCIIELPTDWEDFFCGQDKDLHDAIKVAFYEERIPTQIITRKAVEATGGSKLDNLGLGIYVTAGGKPWKLSDQFINTAYIGIAFGQVIDNRKRLVGVAEIFDEYGQTISMKCMAIREIELDDFFEDKDYHLSTEKLNTILTNLLSDYYESHGKRWPSSVVVHKTSLFDTDEIKAIELFEDYPFSLRIIHLHSGNSYLWNLITDGKEPKRGLYCKLNDSKALVYTSGILQNFDKYYMPGMPSPLLIEDQSKTKNIELSCEEVMKLTKLNWNSTNTYERVPVTISHARKIIDLLRVGLLLDEKYPIDLRFFL